MEEKEFYLHVDFDGKIEQSVFNSEDVYLNIVNLHKRNPLVQVGSYVFQGAYEDCLGTNIYYEEVEDAPKSNNPFKMPSPITLQYLTKTNKVLKLKWRKLPDDEAPEDDRIEIAFKEDYKTVLKKMKDKALKLDDLLDKSTEAVSPLPPAIEKTSENPSPVQTVEIQASTIQEPKEPPMKIEAIHNESEKYERLKSLAKQPVKTKKDNEQLLKDTYQHDDTEEENYLILKQLYLQNLSYKDIPLNINETKLHLYVDIDNSIKNGIINKRTLQNLTEAEKDMLISLENFDSLSLPIQLSLLVTQLKEEKKVLNSMNHEELQEVDEHGRKPRDRYRILKCFTKDIWYHMFTRIKDNELVGYKSYMSE